MIFRVHDCEYNSRQPLINNASARVCTQVHAPYTRTVVRHDIPALSLVRLFPRIFVMQK